MHSSQVTGPTADAKGKKAVIVGCCNSGHDIAQDYYEHGYDVTMIQRSSTTVATSKALIDVTMKGVYAEDGVSLCIHDEEQFDMLICIATSRGCRYPGHVEP